jgi:hypothetical protein
MYTITDKNNLPYEEAEIVHSCNNKLYITVLDKLK